MQTRESTGARGHGRHSATPCRSGRTHCPTPHLQRLISYRGLSTLKNGAILLPGLPEAKLHSREENKQAAWAGEEGTWLLVAALLAAMCSQAMPRDSWRLRSGGEGAESPAASPTFALLFLFNNRTPILPGMGFSPQMTSLENDISQAPLKPRVAGHVTSLWLMRLSRGHGASDVCLDLLSFGDERAASPTNGDTWSP